MTPEDSTPTFGQRMINLIRFVVRLLFTLIVAIGLGAAVYYAAAFGVPALRERYIQPVEENTQRIADLEAQQRQSLEALTQQIESLHTRLTDLEIQNDRAKAQVAELENDLAAAKSAQATQAAALTTLAPMPAVLAETQNELSQVLTTLEDLSAGIDTYALNIGTLQTESLNNTTRVVQMQNELQMLRLMEALTRGRLFISQGNIAQAENSIHAGLMAADKLSETAPGYQMAALKQVRDQLQNALEYLVLSPLRAADQLDGAWQITQQGLPDKPSPTPEAESTTQPAPSPTPSPTITPES